MEGVCHVGLQLVNAEAIHACEKWPLTVHQAGPICTGFVAGFVPQGPQIWSRDAAYVTHQGPQVWSRHAACYVEVLPSAGVCSVRQLPWLAPTGVLG